MIKIQISIGVPSYVVPESKLSSLLQGKGEEQDLEIRIRDAVRAWVAAWIPYIPSREIRVRIEQE